LEKNELIYEVILITKMKDGDKSAFSSIFNYYYANLVLFANNFIHDRDSSEEIVQDVFVHLWENRDVLCITSSLKSYLLKMVQNRCFNWIKHLAVRDNYRDFTLKYTNIFEKDTENYILGNELDSKIKTSLNLLPPKVKEAFLMSRYDGKKYQEIAELQQVSIRTIEDRIGKALSFLKSSLKEYFITILIFTYTISKF
jgi:RNA polymerase sigma-70 factor (family 1)